MDIDTAELRRLAEAVQAGFGAKIEAATILALLDRLERAEALLREARAELDTMDLPISPDGLLWRIDAALA